MGKNRMQALLITPYSSGHKSRIALAQTLRNLGVIPILITKETSEEGDEMALSTQRAIERSDFIIADVSGSNPNVMYEVGYAHALRKPVLPIVRRDSEGLPASMSGYYYLVYDPSDQSTLKREIRSWISHFVTSGRKKT